jgi:hypothetical protein
MTNHQKYLNFWIWLLFDYRNLVADDYLMIGAWSLVIPG